MISNKRIVMVSLMLCLCIIGPLFAADRPASKVSPSADKPAEINEPNFAPGQEFRVDVNSKLVGIDHFMVYVPSDYNDNQDWPVIFFYHGMGGRPTTWPFKQLTEGKGFIVIGMRYTSDDDKPMTEGQYINYMKRERKSALEVKRYVSNRLRIDEKRLFVTGSSKGGWHASALLESSPNVWAGAVILAAGRSQSNSFVGADANRRLLRGKPIYIGAGEKDMNLAAAKKAAEYYEKVGAKVTFEEFKGAGHAFDPNTSGTLRNWIIANRSVENTQSRPSKDGISLKADEKD